MVLTSLGFGDVVHQTWAGTARLHSQAIPGPRRLVCFARDRRVVAVGRMIGRVGEERIAFIRTCLVGAGERTTMAAP